MPDPCKDCGSTEAYDFYPRKGNKGTPIWLCLDCLKKRINAPESIAARQLAEFKNKGGKPS
jgi:hypothetical protein